MKTSSISKMDEDFIRHWHAAMTGSAESFEEFMGDQADPPREGHNRMLLREFINQSNPDRQILTIHLMQLYHHKACSDRANAAARTVRWTGIGSSAVAILTIWLAVSGMVEWEWALVLGVFASLALIVALASLYLRMERLKHGT